MNFQNMPELQWTLGYPLALLLMAVISGSLWLFFKRSGWL
jgi:magnesium transporter